MDLNKISIWRKAIEAVDPVAADSRQRLNQLYTEIVTQLRQKFQSTTFTVAALSFDQQRAAESADPSTKTKRLWQLASHHPGAVANNPIWSLILLEGKGLTGKNESIDGDGLFPLAQVEGLWQEVHRRHPDDYHDKLLLSYTALLPLARHPFHEHALVRALYEAGDLLSPADLKFLEAHTNELDYGREMLQSNLDALQPLSLCRASLRCALPGALQSPDVDDVLIALSPVFVNDDELFGLMFGSRNWGHQSVFLDVSPVADQLLSPFRRPSLCSAASAWKRIRFFRLRCTSGLLNTGTVAHSQR